MAGFKKPMKKPSYRILSRDDIDSIHWATLETLKETGVRIVKGENVLKKLSDEGCKVDFKNERVFFSPSMVEESVDKASKIVTVYSPRNRKYDYKLDGRHIYVSTDGLCVNTADLDTGEWKLSTSEDLARIVKVTDALDSYPSAGGMTSSFDKPEQIRGLYDVVTKLNNTVKPTGINVGGGNVENPELVWKLFDYQLEAAKIVAGGEEALRKRPLLRGGFWGMSPLQFHGVYVERALKLAELGFPGFVGSMTQAGATAPVTLAGILTVTNAEVLGGVSIFQLLYPGTQILVSYCPSSFDMKYGKWAAGAPEEALMNAASVEVSKYYGFPADVDGLVTSANVPGPQACIEKMMSSVLPLLAGPDIFGGAGGLGCAMTASLEELVIDDELCKAMLTSIRGVEVNDETLAVDVVNEVGPGGHYLDQKHTMNHFLEEQFIPELIDRRGYEEWNKGGRKSLVDRAREKVKEILKDHSVPPLDKGVQKGLSNLIHKAERELLKL